MTEQESIAGVICKTISVTQVPLRDIAFLRPYAVRAGLSGITDSGIGRFAITRLATLLRKAEAAREEPPEETT